MPNILHPFCVNNGNLWEWGGVDVHEAKAGAEQKRAEGVAERCGRHRGMHTKVSRRVKEEGAGPESEAAPVDRLHIRTPPPLPHYTRGIGPYSSPEQAEKMTDTGFLLSSCLQRGSGSEFCLSELLTR